MCTECNKSKDFWLDDKSCLKGSLVPQRKGKDINFGLLRACVDSSCLECFANFAICTKCVEKYSLVNEKCVEGSNLMLTLIIATSALLVVSIVVYFLLRKRKSNMEANYMKSIEDEDITMNSGSLSQKNQNDSSDARVD